MDMNLFYSALAAATTTLLGLLFVAIQLNRERLLKEPTGQWKALAVSTFQTYVLLLIVALFAFMPLLRSIVLWISALIGIYRQVRAWLPVWRGQTGQLGRQLLEALWLFVAPTLVWAWLVFSALQLREGTGSTGVEINIGAALVLLLAIVLRNSWRLLFEIPAEDGRS